MSQYFNSYFTLILFLQLSALLIMIDHHYDMLCFYCFRPSQLVSVTFLSKDDQMILKHRYGLQDNGPHDATICLYHRKINLDCYSSLQKNCSNPYGLHARPIKKSVHHLSVPSRSHWKDICKGWNESVPAVQETYV